MPEHIDQVQEAREKVLALNWQQQLATVNAVALAMLKEARASVAQIEQSEADQIPQSERLPTQAEFDAMPEEQQRSRIARYRAVTQQRALVGKRLQDEKQNAFAALAEVRAQLRTQAELQGELTPPSVNISIEVVQAAVAQGQAESRTWREQRGILPGKPRILDAG